MRHTPLIWASLASAMALLIAPDSAGAEDSIKCNLAWDAASARPSRAGYQNFVKICAGHSRARDARAWIAVHAPTPTPTSSRSEIIKNVPRIKDGSLAPVWLKGSLYGSDNYVAALRKVTIMDSGSGSYRVSIPNQSNWTCDLIANKNHEPSELRNCKSSEPDNEYWINETVAIPENIILSCRTIKKERICQGSFNMRSTLTSKKDGTKSISDWPGTMTIAHR